MVIWNHKCNLEVLRISDTVFEVTLKDQSSNNDGDGGRFTFDASLIFVPGTAVLLLQLTALIMGFRGECNYQWTMAQGWEGYCMCSIMVVLCFWPFLKGLFAKGKYWIPLSTTCKSAILALCFVLLVKRPSTGQASCLQVYIY